MDSTVLTWVEKAAGGYGEAMHSDRSMVLCESSHSSMNVHVDIHICRSTDKVHARIIYFK